MNTQSYRTIVFQCETTDGDTAYMALHDALPGCMAQADTPDEAVRLLRQFRDDYIRYIRRNNLAIPENEPIMPGETIVIDFRELR